MRNAVKDTLHDPKALIGCGTVDHAKQIFDTFGVDIVSPRGLLVAGTSFGIVR